ncbi:hypothetical protein [Pseudomonas sp. OTU5201]|uniref:hypothetical protein n=1 Tax=Pseudomonas sp. OTU5201 TaxID=3043850 RepID=UPI00313DCBE3
MAVIKHLLLPLLVVCCLLEFELARASSDLSRHAIHLPDITHSFPTSCPLAN